MVAYAVFKKVPFHGFFKVMLFLPQMMSSMVFVICVEYIIKNGFPTVFPSLQGVNLLDSTEYSSFWTVLIFGFWMQFAGGLVVYLGAMSSIPQDIIEYGYLEKLSSLKELWYVVVPMIFPTITTYIVVAFAGFFTNQGFFYQFFSGATGHPPFETLGYVFFVKVVGGGMSSDASLVENYPYASAGGLLFTLVCAPLTISVRWLLEKFGPSED
jgi:ABC-type sugar transport system permease subunit